MNGMKNYLIKHGEGEFITVVKQERARLKPNQFLNIDSILECALQKLIIKPLKHYIYEVLIRAHNGNGSLRILSHSIKLAQAKKPEEFGIRPEMLPLGSKPMGEIQQNLRRMQQSYSPIKKLEHLLRCIGVISGNFREKVKSQAAASGNSKKSIPYQRSLSGDDLLPMLVYIIVHCGLISVEIEVEYMLGLLHSSILNGGDGSYYLNLWASALQVLKNMYSMNSSLSTTSASHHSSIEYAHGDLISNGGGGATPSLNSISGISSVAASSPEVLKILIPNELTSSIACKSVPVRRNMTTREVCRMIAHTFRITNPEDYALYRIKDLEEHVLGDADLPQILKQELIRQGELTPMFAYKRVDAKFIWPNELPGSPN